MNAIFALFILLIGGTAGAVSAVAAEGTVAGRVVITKTMTKKRVTLPAYDLRGVSVRSEDPAPSAANSPDQELSRVVIFLEGQGLRPAAPVQAKLIQKNRAFQPEIVVVPVGSTVSFPNEDPIFHNVFSLSKVRQFDLGYYPAGETRTVKFDRPGIVQVYCHIHPDMSAAIVVLSSSIWTRLSPDGSFSLPNVTPGSYDLVAWHRFAGFFRRHITVTEGTTQTADFVIPVKDQDSRGKTGSAQ